MTDINSMEHKVWKLTQELSKKCGGHGAAIVIGAGLNIVMTASMHIPDEAARKSLSASFRNMADQLEQMDKPKQ